MKKLLPLILISALLLSGCCSHRRQAATWENIDFLAATGEKITSCQKCAAELSRENGTLTAFHNGEHFLFTPEGLLARLDQAAEADGYVENALSSDEDGVAIYTTSSVYDDIPYEAKVHFYHAAPMDSGDPALQPNIIVSFPVQYADQDSLEGIISVLHLTELLCACDPTLDADTASLQVVNLYNDGSLTLNGVKYMLKKNTNGGTLLLLVQVVGETN